jgi:replication fork protection complex subunit Tof1/Swi1
LQPGKLWIDTTSSDDELEWHIPKSEYPEALRTAHQTIANYLLDPIDINGKRPKQLLTKKRKRRARSISSNSSGSGDDSDAEERKQRRKRKQKEAQVYKSAAVIEDSDAELGDDEAFFAKEKAQRERYDLKAAQSAQGIIGPRGGNKKAARKRQKTSPTPDPDLQEDVSETDAGPSSTAPPKRTRTLSPVSPAAPSPNQHKLKPMRPGLFLDDSDDDVDDNSAAHKPQRGKRIVVSDDEE